MSSISFRKRDDLDGVKYPLIFFFISINLLLLYLYGSSSIAFYASLVTFFLAVIGFIGTFTSVIKNEKLNIHSMLWLSKNYTKMTRKYMLVSVVGVLIAVLIFSQGMLLENSVANQEIRSLNTNYPYVGLVIDQYSYANARQYLPELNEIVADVMQQHQIEISNNYTLTYIKYNNFIECENDSTVQSMKIGVLNENLQKLISTQQDLPAISNDSVFLWNSFYFANYQNAQSLQINDQTYNISYLTADFDSEFYGNELLRDLTNDRVLLISESIFQQLLQSTVVNPSIGIIYYAQMTYSKDFRNTLQAASAVYNEISSRYYAIAGYWLFFDAETILWQISLIDQSALDLKFFFLMGSLPIIVLGFFFADFSFTLAAKKKQEIIERLKSRGASNAQITILLIGEALIIGLFATILAMLLTSPWVSLSLTSSGFLEFHNALTPIYVSKAWLWKIPFIGLILSIDINAQSIYSLTNTSTSKKRSSSKRLQLERWSFIIGLGVYLFLKLYLITNQTELRFFRFISTSVGPTGLALLLFGIATLTGRHFTVVTQWLARRFTKESPPALLLAARNFKVHQHTSAKLLIVLIFAIMLSVVYIGAPYTIENNVAESIHYTMGADNTVNLDQPLTTAQLNQIRKIEGVAAASQVSSMDFIDYRGLRNVHEILFIDPTTFSLAAYWDDRYAADSLTNLVQAVNQSANSVLIPQKIIDGGDRAVGEHFLVNLATSSSDAKNVTTVDLEVAGGFTYFPRVMIYGIDAYSFLPIVANEALLKQIPTWNVYSYLYLKLAAGVDYKTIESEIKQIVPIGLFQNADEILVELIGSANFSILSMIFNNMLVITLLLSILAFVYYSISTVQQRTKEFGLYRSLGMVRSQIFWQLLLESSLLLLYALVVGIVTGYMSIDILASNFLYKRTAVPPAQIKLPWNNILTYILILFLVSVVSSIISLFIVSKRAVANVLRDV